MTLHAWLTSSTVRNYPQTLPGPSDPLVLRGARNEQMSFQLALRLEDEVRKAVRIEAEGPQDWAIRIRRVGYVPVRHHNTPIGPDTDGIGAIPGFVPDPLFDESEMFLPQGETHAFWVTVRSGDVSPGEHRLRLRVIAEGDEPVTRTVIVRLHDLELQPRRDFAITHWFYADALIDWYRTDLFDDRFWRIFPFYARDVVTHGQDTLYVPVFTPPLDGVKRPSQLLDVKRTGADTYAFDWRDVKRYVDLAKTEGVAHFEWTHFFTQWGARHALRIYEGQGRDEQLLWDPDTGATSGTYRAFLGQYLPELYRFLQQEELLDRSFFHVSDEPHGEHLPQYRDDRELLRELAPWMSVMDALTDIDFGREGLTDMPIPSIATALDFVAAGIPCWCYYCCGPRGLYLNRLLDTPLAKIAMHGLLFYRWPFRGFLHWGYNYWYQSQTRSLIDPFTVQDGLGAGSAAGPTATPSRSIRGPTGPSTRCAGRSSARACRTIGCCRRWASRATTRSWIQFAASPTSLRRPRGVHRRVLCSWAEPRG